MAKQRLIVKTLLFILLLLPGYFLVAQENLIKNSKRFVKTEKRLNPHSEIDYYPLADGDYWEFIETDTTTIAGQYYENGLNFSVTKEILFDTVVANGLSYKKIKWNNEANSVNYPPVYEYHRKDSVGNVYLFYQDNEYLLFNVIANTGDTYPAHLPGFIWLVADRYNVIGFGDTLAAIDFDLLENGTTLKETYTLVETFGLIYYRKNIAVYNLPEGNFWGAIIDGEEYGSLIVNKQKVDWAGYYPHNTGDYWVYEGESGGIPFIETHRITGDTLMPDGNIYFIKDYSSFERLDSIGRLFIWSTSVQSGMLDYTFTATVGDTSVNYNLGNVFWRLNDKSFYNNRYELYRFLYPDLIYYGEYYDRGLGLYEWTIEGGYGILKGAYIDGILVGDTTVTLIRQYSNSNATDYILYQNFPNPFNTSTVISFYLPLSTHLQINIYDILGKQVGTILNEYILNGFNKIEFDAKNLSSGIYICVLFSKDIHLSEKIILLK